MRGCPSGDNTAADSASYVLEARKRVDAEPERLSGWIQWIAAFVRGQRRDGAQAGRHELPNLRSRGSVADEAQGFSGAARDQRRWIAERHPQRLEG